MKRELLFFAISFPLCLVLFGTGQWWLDARRDKLLAQQAKIILHGAEDQLSLHLKSVVASQIAFSELWRRDSVEEETYNQIAKKIQETLPEVVGVNLLETTGRIVRIWPQDYNSSALGKVSQNIVPLKESLARGEALWLSPPFRLFQGDQGFAYYRPLTQKSQHIGWLAVVVTSETFFKEFANSVYGRNFHLSAIDEVTGEKYFQAKSAAAQATALQQTGGIDEFGRKIRITIWPKEHLLAPWYLNAWPFVISLLFSAVLSLAYRWWLERKRVLEQLEELNNLLRLTIHDASGTLNTIKGYLDIMQEDPNMVPIGRLSKHVGIVADLLDQIRLVRKFSEPSESWRRERVSLLNLILEVSDFVGDRLNKKNLLLRYDPEKLSSALLYLNKGLFGHSVLGNLIAHVIRTSAPGSVVSIDYDRQSTGHEIRIVSQTLNRERTSTPEDEMGMQIATEVLRLHHGTLSMNTDVSGKTTTTVTLLEGQLH